MPMSTGAIDSTSAVLPEPTGQPIPIRVIFFIGKPRSDFVLHTFRAMIVVSHGTVRQAN